MRPGQPAPAGLISILLEYRVPARARREGRLGDTGAGIGGAVQIHGGGVGNNWTWGCIAMRDEDIDELFALPTLGPGTPVYIVGSEIKRAWAEARLARPRP